MWSESTASTNIRLVPWEADLEMGIPVQECFSFCFFPGVPLGLYLLKGERGSKYSERERENLSCDSAPTKSSADPKESSGAGMAIGDVLSRGMEGRTSRLSVDQSWMQVVLWKKMEP